MPGNYKRTSNRKSWLQKDMDQAIEAEKEKRMGWLLASKNFNVPQATLRRHFYSTPLNLGRYKPTFNADIEKTLVDHMLEFESRLFGFNTTEIRKLAYEFAEKLGLDHRFDKSNKIAGWDWLKGFRERNPNISLRAPEPTSAARARAFNKPQVMKFFYLLEKEVTDNGIQPHRIYNMDESGLNTVQKPPKVFSSKGKKQVGAVTSAERGEHFTVVASANAIGNFVPPALIIPRKNHKAEYFDGSPPGTLEICYPTGYMVGDLFFKWMRHFVAFINASATNKALLILDGHSSHKNLEALEFAKANGVIMLCLPPHCTHRMQPTDVSFFGPLQAYYDREMATWMKNHPGRTIGLYQVAQIFGRAYENAASVRNVTSGFEKTGIYPYNPHIFLEEMYLPSEVTEKELNNDDVPVASNLSQPQLNHEEPDSSDATDAEEQLMEIAAANSHNKIDFQAGANSTEAETLPLSPTILSPNIDTHLLQDHDANISSWSKPMLFESSQNFQNLNEIAPPQKIGNNPLSLKILAANFIKYLLKEDKKKDHDEVISSLSGLMLLEYDTMKTSNTKEQIDITTDPKVNNQEQIIDEAFLRNKDKGPWLGTKHISTGHSPLRPEMKCILKEISPLPKATTTGKSRVNRKVGGSQVLTSSPFMNEIKVTVQQKKEKENRKSLKKQKQTKRVIFEDVDVKPAPKKYKATESRKQRNPVVLGNDMDLEKSNAVDLEATSSKKYRSTRVRKEIKRVDLDDDEDFDDPYANEDAEEDDPACIYCNELFSQSMPKEHWVKCQLCSSWCHTLCADLPEKKKQLICELCS